MKKLHIKLTTAFATGAVLLNALAPFAFAETLTISGNGAGSDSTVAVSNNSTTTVNQNNTANVTNNVNSTANTGNNQANFNTGGNVTVDTGDASTTTSVTNVLNSNQASVGCCNTAGTTDVAISGNGAFSQNTAALTQNSNIAVNQTNTANVANNVTSSSNTGGNQAGFNTGSTLGTGDVTVRTGDASVNTTIGTMANANVAVVAPSTGVNSGTSLMILGNGAGSDNAITVALPSSVILNQTNDARVTNNVTSSANTGDNEANYNTGRGGVAILTGNAGADTMIDNAVNFNAADVDCGCIVNGGLTAEIAGNGAAGTEGFLPLFLTRPSNTIAATLGSNQVVNQTNGAQLANNVGACQDMGDLFRFLPYNSGCGVNTGGNEASLNTAGYLFGGSNVLTGDSYTSTSIANRSNQNILGNVTLPMISLPSVQTSFDLSGMLSTFGLFIH